MQRIFDLAKKDVAGLDSYARQIAAMLENEPRLKQDVFEGLFHIAASDGVLHRDEEHHLKRRIGDLRVLGFSTIDPVRAQFVHDPDDAYTVLGLVPDVSDEALKSRYRELVRENHPDALIARGVPDEFIEMTTRKIAAINAAYEAIAKERGL